MDQFITYISLFGIIVSIGQLFNRSTIPIPLLLVITGMLLSLLPGLPVVTLQPDLVLHIFLPLLVYEASIFFSWKDVRRHLRPIALLSVGHVIFITILVAVAIHALIPALGWPLAFVLGAVISPPDDVAIIGIAEKIRMPAKIVTILEGEGLLNDATALLLFRFALAAVLTHQFLIIQAISMFFAVIVGEITYGLLLGYVMGKIRLKLSNPILQIISSLLTPFVAYIPAEKLGGCGVLATVVTGFVISHRYATRFTPEFRLINNAVWPTVAFAIQSLLFLLVGLNLHWVLSRISNIPMSSLFLYGSTIVAVVIIGRFVWVYGAVAFLPRFLFPAIRKKDPYPPWQYPFVTSWAGMRGAISLAAALAVPLLPFSIDGINPRDLLIFLVFCVITATLVIQGLTLPWLLEVLGINHEGKREQCDEHMSELEARMILVNTTLQWLHAYQKQKKHNKKILADVGFYIEKYTMQKEKLEERIKNRHQQMDEQAEIEEEFFLSSKLIEVERVTLLNLWQEEKINLAIRNKLQDRLDHRSRHLPG